MANIPAREQKRRFARIPFQAKVLLNTFPGRNECDLVDISLKGALVERTLPWRVRLGDLCTLLIDLGGHATIQMAGEVAHVEDNRLGLRCTEIDLESMTNLRRLVELNLGDEAELNREFGALLE